MSSDASVPGLIQTARRVLRQWQYDEVVIMDRSVSHGPGGTTETWIARDEPTKCRFGQVTGFGKITDKEPSLVLDAVIQEMTSQAIQFPEDVEVAEQDRIVQPDGMHWVVVANLTPRSVLKTMVRVVVRELAGGA